MKTNIKNDKSGQKKDFEKLATIKKSEKAVDPKISEAKKIAISQVITGATNQNVTSASSPSTSNENRFSLFTIPQTAFIAPISGTFTNVSFSKDSKYCGPFEKYNLATLPMQNDFDSNYTMNSEQFDYAMQIMKENITLLNNQQSSIFARPPMTNALLLHKMNSSETVTGLQLMEENISIFNDNIQQSSTPVRPKIQRSLISNAINSLQTERSIQPLKLYYRDAAGMQPMEKDIISLNDLSSIHNDQNDKIPTADKQSMEENIDVYDLQQITKPSSTLQSSMQSHSLNTVNSEQIVSTVETLQKNTTAEVQVSISPVQSSLENYNSNHNNKLLAQSSDNLKTQKLSNPAQTQNNTTTTCSSRPPVQSSLEIVNSNQNNKLLAQNSANNLKIQKLSNSTQSQKNTVQMSVPPAQSKLVNSTQNNKLLAQSNNNLKSQQLLKSIQTQAIGITTSTNNGNKNSLHSQNFPTKGTKRKADSIENKLTNSGNTGNKKNKKQRGTKSQAFKKFKNFNKNVNSLMCAIVEEPYPNMPPLTDVHLKIIRNVIKEKIDKLPFGVFAPKFKNSFIKYGVILIECADNASKQWLENAITNYNPEEGIYLKVIPPESINQYYVASIFVRDEKDAFNVLTRLEKQNPDISIRNWQYVSTIIVKESTPGISIKMGIPATSVAQLKEKNFKLFHAVDEVNVVMKVPF